jgi:hypothetical protein
VNEVRESLSECVFAEFQVVGVATILVVAVDPAFHLESEVLVKPESFLVRCPGMTGDTPVIVGDFGDEPFPIAQPAMPGADRQKKNISVPSHRRERNKTVVFDEEVTVGPPIGVSEEPAALLENIVLLSNLFFEFPRFCYVGGISRWVKEFLGRDAHC